MKCPNCSREIDIKKYSLYDCECGSKLLAIQINKQIIIQDVTPEPDEFKRGKSIE